MAVDMASEAILVHWPRYTPKSQAIWLGLSDLHSFILFLTNCFLMMNLGIAYLAKLKLVSSRHTREALKDHALHLFISSYK